LKFEVDGGKDVFLAKPEIFVQIFRGFLTAGYKERKGNTDGSDIVK
jgi:hypothetical protein